MFATKLSMSVAGAAMMLTTAAAQASEKPAVVTASAAATATAAAEPVNLNQRYCIVDDVTGSHILRKECARLGEWKARGIDPTRMRRR